jgi:hypothetical protein
MTHISVRCALKSLAATAGSVILLAGCGSAAARIDRAATAKYIDTVVAHETGFHPADTRCPAGVPATVGDRFNCHFTGPEGPYTVYLRILRVKGRRVDYQMKSQPSSWAPPTLH